jgi:DNA-binding NtrC family response regulator
VRELRNYLERCLVLQDPIPVGESPVEPDGAAGGRIDSSLPYAEARRVALERFEREYVADLLRVHKGKVAQAARAAGIARVDLYRLLRRHGVDG